MGHVSHRSTLPQPPARVGRLTGTAAESVHATSIAGGTQRDPEGTSREPRRRCYGHRGGISLPKTPYQNAARMSRVGRRGRPKRPGAVIRPGWGPGAGMVGNDRPRDFQRAGGARLADLQIQRDVDRASPGRALPQRPVGIRCTVRACGDAFRNRRGREKLGGPAGPHASSDPADRSHSGYAPCEAEGEPCACRSSFPPCVFRRTPVTTRVGAGDPGSN